VVVRVYSCGTVSLGGHSPHRRDGGGALPAVNLLTRLRQRRAYRSCPTCSPSGPLVAPHNLKLWPLVTLALLKSLLMGVFFKIRSPALIEDVYIPEEAEEDPAHFIDALEKGYAQSATNCWIATAMYCASLVVSGWQWWANSRQ